MRKYLIILLMLGLAGCAKRKPTPIPPSVAAPIPPSAPEVRPPATPAPDRDENRVVSPDKPTNDDQYEVP